MIDHVLTKQSHEMLTEPITFKIALTCQTFCISNDCCKSNLVKKATAVDFYNHLTNKSSLRFSGINFSSTLKISCSSFSCTLNVERTLADEDIEIGLKALSWLVLFHKI